MLLRIAASDIAPTSPSATCAQRPHGLAKDRTPSPAVAAHPLPSSRSTNAVTWLNSPRLRSGRQQAAKPAAPAVVPVAKAATPAPTPAPSPSVTIALSPAKPAAAPKVAGGPEPSAPAARAPSAPVEQRAATPLPAPAPAVEEAPAVSPESPVRAAPVRSVAVERRSPTGSAPRLERLSLGEVALVTTGRPQWRAHLVQRTERSTTIRFVPLRTASARPTGVRLLNAARSQGLAANTRKYLAGRGWQQIAIGDAPKVRQNSIILYPPSRRGTAQRLAAQFGFAIASGLRQRTGDAYRARRDQVHARPRFRMMLALLMAASVAAANPVDPRLLEAAHAINTGRLEQARTMIGNAVAAGASGPPVERLLADLAFVSGRNDEALTRYKTLVAGNPADLLLAERAGIAALKAGDVERATVLIERAVTSAAPSWRAWNARGVLADLQRDWPAADAAYSRARSSRRAGGNLQQPGLVAAARGNWGEAIAPA